MEPDYMTPVAGGYDYGELFLSDKFQPCNRVLVCILSDEDDNDNDIGFDYYYFFLLVLDEYI